MMTSITGFIVPTGDYAQNIGLIDLFKEHLKIKMKTVHHTPVEKVVELFVSMVAGCLDIKTVNNRLVPDKLAELTKTTANDISESLKNR